MDTVITISGPAQHGKTTSAEKLKYIFEQKHRRVMILNFADYLKLIATNCYGYTGNKSDPKERTLLQRIGTEVGRSLDPDFWAKIVANTVHAFQNEFDVCIIADARYPNECDILKGGNYDVYNLKVLRRNFDNGLQDDNKNHTSEHGLDFYDFTHYIDAGDLKELDQKLYNFASKFIFNKENPTEKTGSKK